VWNVEDQPQLIGTYAGHQGGMRGIAFLDDVHVVSGGDEKSLVIWDVKKGPVARIPDAHKHPITDIKVISGAKLVATSGADKTIALWRIADLLSLVGNRTEKSQK
jgi:WD40 repeat protein